MRLHIIVFILFSLITIHRCQNGLQFSYVPFAEADDGQTEGEEVDLDDILAADPETQVAQVQFKGGNGGATSQAPAPSSAAPAPSSAAPAPSTAAPVASSTVALSWDWNKNYNLDDDYYPSKYNDDSYYPSKYNDNSNYPSNNYDDNYDTNGYRSKRQYKAPDSMGHMSIYFRESSKPSKKEKPKKIRFPTARYERKRFPRNFGPLISFLPWVPIFADRLTKQTIIFSPTGGIFIIPPVINFYGKLFSVAELIASGYASLVSSGAPPPAAVDVAPLVQPGAVVGPGVPGLDRRSVGFKGGVPTQLRSLSGPKYPRRVY